MSIDEIKRICDGDDTKQILVSKAEKLAEERAHLDAVISSINSILENNQMKFHVTKKVIPKSIVYYSETVLENFQDMMQWIPSIGEECLKLNPRIKCAEPSYEFCEYPDFEYQDRNIKVRHNEAVTSWGKENEIIKFKELPETKVLSVYSKGSYNNIGEAYAYIVNYAKKNGMEISGLPRECYIDGVWNKDSEEDSINAHNLLKIFVI